MDLENVPIVTGHEFETQNKQPSSAVEIQSTRAAQEVQAAMIVAKKFPRDQFAAYNRIMELCKRPSLAAVAQYAYPRGKTMVTGPSIHLAKAIAGAWGNMESGIIELHRGNGYSDVLAYSWDLETNNRQTMQFQVKHIRETKQGSYALEGERDIYEVFANQGSRRLRACILSVIPPDIVEAAEKKCEETLKKGGEPIEDRIRKMVSAFAEFGVTIEMLEKRLQHKMGATIVQELIALGKIYTSIKDGMAKREDFFEMITVDAPQPEMQPSEDKARRHRRTKAEMEAERLATMQPAPPAEPTQEAPIPFTSQTTKTGLIVCPQDGSNRAARFCLDVCENNRDCSALDDWKKQ